jgi:phospholipid/cholesterol/gamma-HCH transport system substrate-binding protein
MASRFRRSLEKSFLERNQRLIGGIGLGLLLSGTAFSLLLTGGVFARTYRVSAVFADAAGIRPGDKVTVAGLDAGTVKGQRIENGRVVMDLAVGKSVRLPAHTRAEIVIQTLLGKRAVNLVAGERSGELRDGSVIPLDRTKTPVDITQLNDISVRLMDRSDAGALNQLMAEVTKVTEGKKEQVGQIVSGLADVAEAVDSRRTQLKSLVRSLRILSTTLGERDQTIVSLIDHLDPVLANLAARQEDIQTLLVATDSASHATADLVRRNRKVLDRTLVSLHQTFRVLDQHQLDLAAAVSYLEDAVQGYQSVGYSGGNCGRMDSRSCNGGKPNQWANIFVQSLGPAGVDALIGKCGAVDRMIDRILGTNCEESSAPPLLPGGDGGGGGGGGIGPLPNPSLPPLPSLPPPPSLPGPPLPTPSLPDLPGQRSASDWADFGMPHNLGDLLSFVLLGWEGPR